MDMHRKRSPNAAQMPDRGTGVRSYSDPAALPERAA